MAPIVVQESGKDTAISALVMAFGADPMARWLYPDSALYLRHFAPLAEVFGGKAFACGSAWQAGDKAAALWLPPGQSPDSEAVAGHLYWTAAESAQEDLFPLLDQMANAHPDTPHWYLPLIGVDPMMQGMGLGSALLEAALKVVDRDGAHAYLESSNARNIPFYERYGFRVTGTIQAGGSPVLYPMLRPAGAKTAS